MERDLLQELLSRDRVGDLMRYIGTAAIFDYKDVGGLRRAGHVNFRQAANDFGAAIGVDGFADAARQLNEYSGNLAKSGFPKLMQLAVIDHGGPGQQTLGDDELLANAINPDFVKAVKSCVAEDGEVLLLGCYVAQDLSYLKLLARTYDRKVVAYTTAVGYYRKEQPNRHDFERVLEKDAQGGDYKYTVYPNGASRTVYIGSPLPTYPF
jgi:hypothetical protein